MTKNNGSLEGTYEFKTHNAIKINYRFTVDYFKEAGFKQLGNFSELEFKKGSIFSVTSSLNPLKWRSNFKIVLSKKEVNLSFFICTRSQLVSRSEIDCWSQFISNYKKSLLHQKNLFYLNNEFVKKSKRTQLRYVYYGISLAILILMLLGFLANYFKLDPKYFTIPTGLITVITIHFIQMKIDNESRLA